MIAPSRTLASWPLSNRPTIAPIVVGAICGAFISSLTVLNFALRRPWEAAALYAAHEDTPVLLSVLATLALVGAAAMSFVASWRLGADYRRQKLSFLFFYALSLSATISGLAADAANMPILLGTMFLAFAMELNIGALDDWRPLLSAFCVAATLVFAFADLLALTSHDYTWGRLGGHAGPNYWGINSAAMLILCLFLKPAWLRVPIVAIALVTLYFAQARGSMLGAAVGLSLMAGLKLARMPARRSVFWAVVGVCGLAVILILFGDLLAKKILLLNDANRGAGSKGSGRLLIWQEVLSVVGDHPLIGVGLHQVQQYLRAASVAHNAYLSTLGEQGLVGLTIYLVMMVGGLVRISIKALRDPTAPYLPLAGFIGFFLGLGLLEAYSLQTGNAYSVIVLICIAIAWRVEIPAPSHAPLPIQAWGRTAPAQGSGS